MISGFSFLISLVCFCLSIYGIVLGFRAHVLLGILLIFLHPIPLVVGAVKLAFDVDLAERTVDYFQSLSR